MPKLLYAVIGLYFFTYFVGVIRSPFVLVMLVAACAALASFMTAALARFLEHRAIFDKPNARSMHHAPVPRGGGLVFVLLLVLGFLATAYLGSVINFIRYDAMPLLHRSSFFVPGQGLVKSKIVFFSAVGLDPLAWRLLIGLLVLAAVSWWDDMQGLSARLRLLAQCMVVGWVLHVCPVEQIFGSWIPGWIMLPVVMLAWVWFINLYNFMDGIDGITGAETLHISAVISIIGLEVFVSSPVNDITMMAAIVLLSASIGFLAYNWHPAQLFLGDVGSVTIGYILGFCLLHIAVLGYWYVALTLPLYYLADSGLTLGMRLWQGEKIWQAHRSHLYQIAAQAAGRHDVVVYKIALCNLALAALALGGVFYSPWVCALAPAPVIVLLRHLKNMGQVTYSALGHG